MISNFKDGSQQISGIFKARKKTWNKTYQQASGRKYKSAMHGVGLINGHTVLDIGCNAGLFTAALSLSNKAIGIDPNKGYASKARDLVEHIKDIPHNTIEILHTDLYGFVETGGLKKYGVDAIFASRVVYHLSDRDMDALINRVLPVCNKVLIISRENKGKSNSYIKDVYKANIIEDMLIKQGFSVTKIPDSKHNPLDIKVLGVRTS